MPKSENIASPRCTVFTRNINPKTWGGRIQRRTTLLAKAMPFWAPSATNVHSEPRIVLVRSEGWPGSPAAAAARLPLPAVSAPSPLKGRTPRSGDRQAASTSRPWISRAARAVSLAGQHTTALQARRQPQVALEPARIGFVGRGWERRAGEHGQLGRPDVLR